MRRDNKTLNMICQKFDVELVDLINLSDQIIFMFTDFEIGICVDYMTQDYVIYAREEDLDLALELLNLTQQLECLKQAFDLSDYMHSYN